MATTAYGLDNLSDRLTRSRSFRFIENGAGTYVADVLVPAYAYIDDIALHAEALWAAATSAAAVVGDYNVVAGSPPTLGTVITANGFFASTNLKATDLLAGESINFYGAGGVQGSYVTDIAAPGSQITKRVAVTDRFIRCSITSVGAGTTGRTIFVVKYTPSVNVEVTQ